MHTTHTEYAVIDAWVNNVIRLLYFYSHFTALRKYQYLHFTNIFTYNPLKQNNYGTSEKFFRHYRFDS